MHLDKEVIKRTAELARLNFSEEEIIEAQKDLQKILTSFEVLLEVPISHEHDARSAFSTKGLENKDESLSHMEKDQVENSITTSDFLAQTPSREGAFVRVPAILAQST